MSSPNQSEPETEIEKELEYETVVVKEDGEHYNDDDDHAVLEASETTQCSFISFEPEESGKIYLEDETNEDEEEIIKDNDASGTLTMEPLIVETDGESTRHSDDSMIDNNDEKQIDNTVDDEEKLEEQNVNDEIESEKDENCIEEAVEAEALETEINSKDTVSDVDKTSDTRIAEKRKANDVNDNKEDFLGFGEDDFDVFDEIKMQNLIVIVRMIEKAKDESVEESNDQLDDEPKAKRAKPLNSTEGENDIQTVTEKKQSTITTKIQTNSSGRRKSVNMTKECDIEMEDESMIEDDAESPPELIIDQNENDNEHDDFDDIEDKDKDSIDNRKEATSKLTSRNKSNSSSGRGTPSSVQKPKPITDEIYRRPFNMGWKREVVYRAIPGISKDKGEVYYITPNGKKLRTKNDIIANLTNGLSIDNFTFAKAPIGMGEEYEIIRNAKPITRYVPPLVSLGKRVPKPKGPKGASPPPMGWTATKAVITQTQITPVVRTSTIKKPSQDGVDLMKPTTSSQSSKPSVGKTSIKKKGEPCTIQCVDAMGIIPQLKCIKCLCLFHHECVAADDGADDTVNRDHKNLSNSRVDDRITTMGSQCNNQGNSMSSAVGGVGYVCESCKIESSHSGKPASATVTSTETSSQQEHPAIGNTNNNSSTSDMMCKTANASSNTMKSSLTSNTSKHNKSDNGKIVQKSLKDTNAPKNDHDEHILHLSNDKNNNNDDQQNDDEDNNNTKKKLTTTSAHGAQSIVVVKGRKYLIIKTPPSPTVLLDPIDKSQTLLNTPFKPNTTLNWEQTPKSAKYPRISARRVGGGSVPYVRSPRTKDEKHYEDDNEGSPAHRRLQRNDKKHVCPANAFEANFFGNVASGYNILLHTFQYLKVQELLQVSSVCRFWNVAANHRSLWKTIRMKNSQVNDWTGLAAALKRNETKHLDMRKMLIISSKGEEMWKSFAKNIRQVTSLENIDICRCSSKIVQDLFVSNPNLKIVNAVTIRDDAFCLDKVKNLKGLEELRLKSTEGFSLIGDLSPLSNLKNLKHLSLTSFKSLCSQGVKPLANLVNLETLELGDCDDLDITFAEEVLPKLTKIERLRLERGVGDICTLEIMDTISRLERLTQLELVNFDVKRGFDDKLIQCKNLKRLLIIPTYISASATTNQIILNATLNMSDILEVFTWAVTMELLRVTSLYVDQCENRKDDPNFEECIPVLQPVPGMVYKRPMDPIQQVEILPLKRIEEIVSQLMPRTKLKILKVPYHATWRQTIFVGRVASASSSVSSCTSNSSSTTRSRRERGTSDT